VKIMTPMLLALLGLGAGLGAGVALKPAPPEPVETACAEHAEPDEPAGHAAPVEHAEMAEHDGGGAEPCPEPDPFAPVAQAEKKPAHELAYVTMDKPFVVPVFSGEKVVAMVVVSLSVETESEAAPTVEGVKPRLRDSFLKAMFRHANSGGFDGSFTAGRKMDDLKSALLQAAQAILPETPVEEVLITEIARQDV
jgi:flagellar protein FliL